MDKSKHVSRFIEANHTGRLVDVKTLPPSASQREKADALNIAAGAVGPGTSSIFPSCDGRVGIAVGPDGRIAGMIGNVVYVVYP
jgi:hypothetical protein